MKKFLSSLLCFTLIFSLFSYTKAASTTKIDLKNAILIAKSSFEFDDRDLKFTYNLNSNENKSFWNLSWTGKNKQINIQVNAQNGDIISMYRYEGEQTITNKIPKYSKEKAKEVTEGLIRKLVGEKFKEFVYDEANSNYLYYNPNYDFRYTRRINGIDYKDNFISVSVDKNNLKIMSYYFEYDYEGVPTSQNIITLEKAKEIFESKMGLELSYKVFYDYEKNERNVKLIYTPKSSVYPIDAVTGEILKNPIYIFTENSQKDAAGALPTLTPEEIKAIEENKKLISKEEVENILVQKLGLNKELNMEYINLGHDLYSDRYIWTVYYSKTSQDKSNYYYFGATIDALTGEILSFYRNFPNIENYKEPKYTKQDAKKIAEDFINSLSKDKFIKCQYREVLNVDEKYVYSFEYRRIENSIPVANEGFTISISPYTGEVLHYYQTWSDIVFPKVENIISIDKAHNILYSKNNFKLNYMKYFDYDFKMNKYFIKLVYSFTSYNFMIDAKEGILLDYSGKPLKEVKKISYSDIKNSPYYNDINILIDIGIIDDEGENFYPNQMIRQKNFIKYIVKSLEPNYIIYREDTKEEYENYYEIAIKKGIISSKEKNPNAYVTRQDAAKWIIRAMGVGFIAELSNLYTLNFKDSKLIPKNYKGYIALANELKIITPIKGYFMPRQSVTRGEAAKMLVNYLKVEKQ
ncbi:S-layer homology domain-containing protein [Caloramator sp. CAR-1]|uniref:YcdB/YcdC domain-containing protein n=1 Tax=Caloramator sp. CAR-1 TaxID=3062777 RepID=UPI0026E38FE4|nr:YcdB/YcdC domain-containing protein [Caloramator sp. CAR-1]MDO6354641.1 S-layer homology domain-containing protein [Caloramator sp. CAR-1]